MSENDTASQAALSRRRFLALTAGATAGSMFPLFAFGQDEVDPRVHELVKSTFSIDTHNHVDVPLTAADVPGPKLDLAAEMTRSGLSAICMTFAVDYQRLTEPGQAYERFKNGLTSMDQQLELNKMKRSLNLADLQAAHTSLTPTVIQSVEGGHFLEGKLERLEEAYRRGLRHLGLLHDNDASVPLGDIYTNPPRWGGLTDFGKAVVKECERLGILIDLTHADSKTVADVLGIATKPVMFSHTGLSTVLGTNPSMAQMMAPRLISPEGAKRIANAGGVVGVWTHLSDSPHDYVAHLRAMVTTVGVDHVCIGTDTKLTAPLHIGGPMGPRPGTGPHPDGKSQGGPGPGRRIGERTNEAWASQKAGFYVAVVDQMLKQGFSDEEIGKIGGGNFRRIFAAATTV